jgi:hypothetical protein
MINACTHSNMETIQGSPKMGSTSHKEFKYFKVASLLELFACILTIKGQYCTKTYFVEKT